MAEKPSMFSSVYGAFSSKSSDINSWMVLFFFWFVPSPDDAVALLVGLLFYDSDVPAPLLVLTMITWAFSLIVLSLKDCILRFVGITIAS